MRIWLLRPIEASAPEWAASVYNGDVYVRAPSEKAARAAACAQFCRTNVLSGAGSTNRGSWTNPDVASARVIDRPAWPIDGELEVLHPVRGSVKTSDVDSLVAAMCWESR